MKESLKDRVTNVADVSGYYMQLEIKTVILSST